MESSSRSETRLRSWTICSSWIMWVKCFFFLTALHPCLLYYRLALYAPSFLPVPALNVTYLLPSVPSRLSCSCIQSHSSPCCLILFLSVLLCFMHLELHQRARFLSASHPSWLVAQNWRPCSSHASSPTPPSRVDTTTNSPRLQFPRPLREAIGRGGKSCTEKQKPACPPVASCIVQYNIMF